MPADTTILDAVNAELGKNTPTPEPVAPVEEEPILEENQPNKKPEDKEPPVDDKKEDKAPDPKDKDKSADKDFKPVKLGEKFVTYERFKDVNEKYKALKQEQEDYQKNRKDPELDEDQKEERERLKKLGMTTQDEVEQNKFKIKEDQIRQEEQMILDKEFKTLEREFDGSDGLPAFKKDDVMKRGIENQVFDPKSAYIVMNLNQIVNHQVKMALVEARSKPAFAKGGETRHPDLKSPEKLTLKGNVLQNFLTEKIKGMMGTN